MNKYGMLGIIIGWLTLIAALVLVSLMITYSQVGKIVFLIFCVTIISYIFYLVGSLYRDRD